MIDSDERQQWERAVADRDRQIGELHGELMAQSLKTGNAEWDKQELIKLLRENGIAIPKYLTTKGD